MTRERQKAPPGSDAPRPDLRSERDRILKELAHGAEPASELARECERLESRVQELELETATLRAKLETDHALRELIHKIETLEREKAELLSRFQHAEAVRSKVSERIQEVELELANLASLFVASHQLHSSLSPRGVARRIKDVLGQIVGAERYAVYLADAAGAELVPIASEGVLGQELTAVRVSGTKIGEAFRARELRVEEELDSSRGSMAAPVAIIPLSADERAVGVIAIFSTLSQKSQFQPVDLELFRLLGQQAATALVGATLFAQADRKLPGLEAFLDLSV